MLVQVELMEAKKINHRLLEFGFIAEAGQFNSGYVPASDPTFQGFLSLFKIIQSASLATNPRTAEIITRLTLLFHTTEVSGSRTSMKLL